MNDMSKPGGADTTSALILTRVFDAPPDVVFTLWSDPEHVQEWWHPKGFTTPEFVMDFREGGAYRYSIRSNEQSGGAHGIYKEIDAPHRIVMTFQWDIGDAYHTRETLITITFEPAAGGKTRMTFRQEPFKSDADRHSHGQGWSQVLDAFAVTLEELA